jgi:hypothetical protein
MSLPGGGMGRFGAESVSNVALLGLVVVDARLMLLTGASGKNSGEAGPARVI